MQLILLALLLQASSSFAAETVKQWEMSSCRESQCVRITSPQANRGEFGPVFYLRGQIQVELRKNLADSSSQILKGATGYYEPELGIVTIELSDGKNSFIYLVKEGRWGFLPNS